MGAPKVERGAFFGCLGISIVGRSNAAYLAGPMVQHGFNHMRLNAQARHAARCRAAQIVKLKPRRNCGV